MSPYNNFDRDFHDSLQGSHPRLKPEVRVEISARPRWDGKLTFWRAAAYGGLAWVAAFAIAALVVVICAMVYIALALVAGVLEFGLWRSSPGAEAVAVQALVDFLA